MATTENKKTDFTAEDFAGMSMKEYMTLKTMILQQAEQIEALKKQINALVAQIDSMNEQAAKPRRRNADAL